MKIQIFQINVNDGRRKVDPKAVQTLADSISKVGLLNPITVDRKYTLIAGLHRLEAVKLLGWSEIACTVCDLEGLEIELAEIDENLIRKELDLISESEQLARRKEIYEILHPETRRGMRNGQTSKSEATSFLEAKPFTQDTSEKTGESRRTVEKKLKIAKDLTPGAKRIVKENSIGIENAIRLTRLPLEQQEDAASQLASKAIRSIAEYHPAQQEEPAGQGAADGDPQEKADNTEPDVHTPPAGETIRGSALFREIVADLKNADKDFSCTPDSFLAEIASFVQNFQKELDWYNMPYYEAVYPALTPEQFRDFRRQMETICTAVQNLIHHVEVNVK